MGALTISTLGARPALAETYTLHHRIWPSQWSERGIITTSQSATSGGHAGKELFASASSASYQDTTGKQQPWERLDGYESTSESFYQLALTPGSKGKVDDLTPATFARVVRASHSTLDGLSKTLTSSPHPLARPLVPARDKWGREPHASCERKGRRGARSCV